MRLKYYCTGIYLLILAAGCSSNQDNRQAVAGSVSLKGKPLDNGSIIFYPVETNSQAGSEIKAGKFTISKEQGLIPGKYKVFITSPDGKTPDVPKDTAPGPSGNFASKDRVPASFNIDSKLEIEVKGNTPNHFSFDIP